MKAQEQIDILSRLCNIGRELSSSTDTDELLAKISSCSSEMCDSETASIILLDEEREELYFKETSGEMGEIIKRIRIPLSENSIAGHCILNRKPVTVNDISLDNRHYENVDRITRFTTRSILAMPIIWGDKVFGCIEAVNKKGNKDFSDKDREYLAVLAHQAAVALNNVFLMERLKNFFSHSVEILIDALEALEPETRGHIIRVTRIATTLARLMGIEGKELHDIWYASYFHDIGKLSRESIYMSREQLENCHPELGASLIEKIKFLENCSVLIKFHHEYLDGSGFPYGLKGDQIPLGAQILGIAENFDEACMKRDKQQNLKHFKEQYLETVINKFEMEILRNFNRDLERYF
jgi:putative nucleotidyltransferase with HDIG domain